MSDDQLRLLEVFNGFGEAEQRARDAMESRILAAIAAVKVDVSDVSGDLVDFVRVHGADHAAQRLESETAHSKFQAFMQSAEIASARKDGALGVIRFMGDLAGRNWRAVAAGAAAIAALSGAIHVDIGVR